MQYTNLVYKFYYSHCKVSYKTLIICPSCNVLYLNITNKKFSSDKYFLNILNADYF